LTVHRTRDETIGPAGNIEEFQGEACAIASQTPPISPREGRTRTDSPPVSTHLAASEGSTTLQAITRHAPPFSASIEMIDLGALSDNVSAALEP
jgi:hypothetical protein